MATTVIIRHVEATLSTQCPRIHESGVVGTVSAPDAFARMYFTCFSGDGYSAKQDSVSVTRHSNASELIQKAIDIAVSHFGGSRDNVRVMNSAYDVIPFERIMIDLPDGQQKEGVAVEERYLPLREARAALIGLDGIVQTFRACSAK